MTALPQHSNAFKTSVSVMTFDEAGILYVVTIKGPPPTLCETRQALRQARDFIGHRRVCILLDVTHCTHSSRAVWNYVARILGRQVKALALLPGTPLGRLMANLLFTLTPQPYPVQLFNEEPPARRWLQKFL